MNEVQYTCLEIEEELNHFEISIELPINFENNLLKIKHEYVRSRKQMGDESVSFENKILRLAAIALSIDPDCDHNFAQYYAWSVLNLQEIFLLFSSEKVREVFCNQIGSFLTITHEDYNHCQTNLPFTSELWSALRLQSEINSNKILSFLSPTLKTGLITRVGNLRVTLQQQPLTINSPSFLIRRLPKKPIQLDTLINQNQISSMYAEILRSLLSSRKNVIIAGEPGSGKTTLANAILLESDPSWRTIIIEDASEIILPKYKFPLLQHYAIPSLDYNKSTLTRETEIVKLLHRSPDYVFLGEIQTNQDTLSIFEAFAAGIRGIATTHARTFESLQSRWKVSHGISEDLIRTIDAIVITKRQITESKTRIWVSDVYLNDSGSFNRLSEDSLVIHEGSGL